jgi:hypothetical protein
MPEAAANRVGLEIERPAHRVRLRSQVLPLTDQEFRLMNALAEEPGRALSFRELLATVWNVSPEGGSSALPAIVHDAIGRSSIRPVATVLHRRPRGGDLRQAFAHRALGRIGDCDVAEGDDAHEHVRLQNRQTPHLMLTHQIAGVRQPCIRSDGHRGRGGDVAHDDPVRIRALGEYTNHEVPIRDQTDQSLAVCHGQHSHIQVAHLPSRIGDGGTR